MLYCQKVYCLFELTIVVTLLFFFPARESIGLDMAELEVDHALTSDFMTPHTKWARPYALGKIRVLFFADGRGTNPRECVELMQRFDLDAKAVFWVKLIGSDVMRLHGGEVGERRMDNLLEQKWDCFVFLGIPLAKVPIRQKQRILETVRNGAGIVFVGTDDDGLFSQDKRLDPPLFLAKRPVGEVYRVNRGRGMRLQARPDIDYYEGWEVDYDYWQERLGRAVLWAAGKEPVYQLQMTISSDKTPTEDSKRTLSVKLNGKPAGLAPTLHLSIRGPGHDPIAWPEKKFLYGNSFVFEIHRLSEGLYHADARVSSSAGIETWDTIPFKIKHNRRIARLMLDRGWGEPGSTISGHVELEGNALGSELIRVQLLDRRRRELMRKDLDLSSHSSSVPFKFEITEWLPRLTTVEARLICKGSENSRAYQYFRVTRRRQGHFNFLIWDFPRGTLAPYAEESLSKHGVTLQLGQGNPPPYVAASEISWVPYTSEIHGLKSPEGIMKPFCWNDIDAATKHVSKLASKFAGSRDHGAFVYDLGDEIDTRGSCLSQHCVTAFHDYLKQTYGTLEALNTSWGTAFNEWGQVGLSFEGDDEESNSLRKGNYPRWFDKQAFNSWNFVQYCRKHADAYRAMDPRAKTGFEGAGQFANGDDLDLIVRSLDFWTPYPGTTDEVIRSIAGRDFIRSNWMGYTKDADSLLKVYWRMVTMGMDSVWWWRWETIGKYHGWLAPDLRPFPAVRALLNDTRIIRDGLGDLLLKSEMQDDGIAILYSYPSVFASRLQAGPSFGEYEQAHKDAAELVRGMGLQFRYVTDRMLRLGEFEKYRYKVLILPRAEAIGDKEAKVIRDFVMRGGTLVAGLRPGIYDGHCKPRQSGALDDIFGIRRLAANKARIIAMPGGNGQGKIAVDPGIKPAGCNAAYRISGVPLFISRDVGKGKAILLNCQICKIAQLVAAMASSGGDGSRNKAHTIKSLFAGIEPALQLRNANTDQPAKVLITRWRNGDMNIVSLFRETEPDERVMVSLPQARFVYDLRNRRALGKQVRFSTTLLTNRASFFVFTKSSINPPTLTLGQDCVAPGAVVKLTLSSPNGRGLDAYRVRVSRDNASLEWFDRVEVVGHEPVDIHIPFAYNDRQGKYQIMATDLFTDRTVSAELSLTSQIPVLKNK